jgi:uncharacterized protein
MRKLLIILCLSLPWLTSAAEKQKPEPKTDAQKYAAALSAYLAKIEAEVADKVKAEQDYYTATADIYEAHYSDNILQSLSLERRERGEALADQSTVNKMPQNLSSLRSGMLEQARSDVANLQQFTRDEQAIRNAYLAGIAQLSAGDAKVKALKDAIDKLAVPSNAWGNLKDLASFGEEVDASFTKLKCADLKKEIDQLTKQKGDLDKVSKPSSAQKAQLQSVNARLADDQKVSTNKCKDSTSGGGTTK